MNKILVSFLLILIFASCKKEKSIPPVDEDPTPIDNTIVIYEEIYTNDTIESDEYFSAYPGSWWKYNDSTTITCSEWKLIPVIKKTKNELYEYHKKYFVTVPIYNNWYIFGNGAALILDEIDSVNIATMLNETPGTFYTDYSIGYNQKNTTEHISYGVLDTLRVNDILFYNVLHIKEKYTTIFIDFGSGPVYFADKYYAKGIGLIQKIEYNPMAYYDTTSIVNYYVAPH